MRYFIIIFPHILEIVCERVGIFIYMHMNETDIVTELH